MTPTTPEEPPQFTVGTPVRIAADDASPRMIVMLVEPIPHKMDTGKCPVDWSCTCVWNAEGDDKPLTMYNLRCLQFWESRLVRAE